jgi:elongation factor P
MKIDGNQVKVGNILEINSKLWRVRKTQHTQPGKGGAYIQVEMKELKEGTKMNTRFRSSESVEKAILEEKECQFLYANDEKFYFMDNQSFEQIEIGTDIVTEYQKKFLIENDNIIIQLHESKPVSIILPDHITLKVLESEVSIKGQTATSSYKPVLLEKNIKTNVPAFIDVGDIIVIDTRDASYVEKAKNKNG